MLVVGDLNTCIERLWDQREEEPETIIAAHGLEDQAQQFLPRCFYQGKMGWTWMMW